MSDEVKVPAQENTDISQERKASEDPELEAIKRRLRQAEEEAARLNEMQAQVEREMSSAGVDCKFQILFFSSFNFLLIKNLLT